MVVLLDDADRENEGDIVCAAELCTPEQVNFLKKHARGLICVSTTEQRLRQLNLPLMTSDNTSVHTTAFTISVDATEGTTTGISAYDMARTINVMADPRAVPDDLRRPGHIFPLRAADGGVLRRRGQTEGSMDLCRIAGLQPVAVLCEIVADDGTMAREPELRRYSAEHGLPLLHVQDLVRYRLLRERLIEPTPPTRLPTAYGEFALHGFDVPLTGEQHIALVYGQLDAAEPTLVRLHSECLTGDALRSLRCDCGEQLAWSLRRIAAEGRGVLVYMRQEGRGIGLLNKLRAYGLQDGGLDTVDANLALSLPADSRDYSIGAQILRELGVGSVRLITNNPQKIAGLEAFGLDVVRVPVPLEVMYARENAGYLAAKAGRMGHLIELDASADAAAAVPEPPAGLAWRWG